MSDELTPETIRDMKYVIKTLDDIINAPGFRMHGADQNPKGIRDTLSMVASEIRKGDE